MFVVACVTAAMICILSAFNGIESLVSELFTTFDAEISISPAQGKTFEVSDSLLAEIQNTPGIKAVAQVVEADVIIRFDGQPTVATIKGVDTTFASITNLPKMMRAGEFQLYRNTQACAIPGLGIQSELGIPYKPNEFALITISAPIRGKKLSKYKEKALNTEPILVSGVFSVNAELDVKYVVTPLDFARKLLGYEKEVSFIDCGVEEGADVEDLQETLQKKLGNSLEVKTRYQKNAVIHQTNRTEKWATFLILFFILVIAAFNVMASLTMLIMEKRKDIFILKSMGLINLDIRRIFSYQGMLINGIGALIGLAAGLALCIIQQKVGIIPLQGSIVEYYPMKVEFPDVLKVIISVATIGTLFSVVMVRYLIKRFVQ
jgi:lipoprotein-releasing system permease protein